MGKHFNDSFLLSLPDWLSRLVDTDDESYKDMGAYQSTIVVLARSLTGALFCGGAVPEPNLDAHVFLRITRPVGTFTIDNRNEDQVDLNPNDVILGRSASSARLATTTGATDRSCPPLCGRPDRYRSFQVLLESDQAQLL